MRTAVLYGPHDFRIEETKLPQLNKDECLIKIKACGVCHSEIHQWETKIPGLDYPRFIGHEVAGEVLEAGTAVKNFKPGDRIAAWTDGRGYAEEIVLKESLLSPVNDNISFEYALSEPIACTTNAVLRTNVQLGDVVAISGTGFMGLILLQQLKFTGAKKIIALDVRDEILNIAGELGADIIINSQKSDAEKEIKKITGGKGVDVSIECGGVQATIDLAAKLCRMEGKLVIFGYHPGERIVPDLGYWNWMAFDIINAHFRNPATIMNGMRIGMEMLNSGQIRMDKLITHKFSLDQIEDAFNAAKNKPDGFIKSVIMNN